jgi:hypothetical protein
MQKEIIPCHGKALSCMQVLRPLSIAQTDLHGFHPGTYVLELAATESRDCLVAALSDRRCQLYAVSGSHLELVSECTGHSDLITGVPLIIIMIDFVGHIPLSRGAWLSMMTSTTIRFWQ